MNTIKYRAALNAKRLMSRALEKSYFRRLSTESNLNATNIDRNDFGKDGKNNPYILGSETHFGFESVGVSEKEDRVKEVFENVADSYDVMNDFLSGGLHRFWKDRFLDASAVTSMAQVIRQQQLDALASGDENGQQSKTLQILDVAGGTGDISFRFLEAAGYPERTQSSGEDPICVTVCDINREMLRVGEERAKKKYGTSFVTESKALSFVEGNAQDLKEFEDDSFDLYTIAFGLRNVTDVDKGLSEAFRVLKPGGRFMCLEFSKMTDSSLQQLYDMYSFAVIPEIGELIAKDRASYQYLVESIRKFSDQEELLTRMNNVGFHLTKYTNLTGGIVAIHEGWKPIE
mmetsp:Transcript_22275/g.52959  ORF Transcript_22275/g.52959 Transcript_22275/m.52959 type:complete len:345 (+) Transcript_22275:117-1151(+)